MSGRHKNARAAEDWAAKRRAAVERAKKLREERRRGTVDEEHTFKPKTREYVPPVHTEPRKQFDRADSLDQYRDEYDQDGRRRGGGQTRTGAYDDRMDRISAQNGQIPSPGSDALTYEVRKFGHDDPRRMDPSGHPSGFDVAPAAAGYPPAASVSQAEQEAQQLFHSTLRGGDDGASRNRPAWNSDFASPGPTPAADAPPARAGSGRRKRMVAPRSTAARAGPPVEKDPEYYNRMRQQLQEKEFDPSRHDDYAAPARHAPASGRRGRGSAAKRPEWNSDFADAGAAREDEVPPAAAPALPRRAAGASGRRPEWGGEEEEQQPQQQQARRRVGSGRARRAGGGGRPEWNSEFAEGGAPAPAPAPVPAGARRGRGRLISAAELAGGAPAAAQPQSRSSGGGRPPAQHPPRGRMQTMEELEHEVAKPKLSLLKRRMKSGKSFRIRRARAGSAASQRSGSESRSSSRGNGDSTGDWDSSSNQVEEEGGYGNGPVRHEDAVPAAAAAAPRARRPVRHSNARASPAPAPAPARRGGAPPASQCTRQQGCPCEACTMAMAPAPAAVQVSAAECQRNSSCTCPACSDPFGQAGAPVAVEVPRVPCSTCGRKFIAESLERHMKVCRKVFVQKRKKFDSTAARVEGTEAEKFVKGGGAKQRGAGSRRAGGRRSRAAAAPERALGGAAAKKEKWKQKSSAFRDAMKAARDYKKAVAAGKPPPPMAASAPDPSLVPCPHCGRTYNEKAAERHIPRCATIQAKPTRLIRGTGGAGMRRGGRTAAAAPSSRRVTGSSSRNTGSSSRNTGSSSRNTGSTRTGGSRRMRR